MPTVLLGDKVVANTVACNVNLPSSRITLFASGLTKRRDFVLLRLRNHPRLESRVLQTDAATPR